MLPTPNLSYSTSNPLIPALLLTRTPMPPRQRSIIVDNPELGYPKGVNELPAAATFELKIEVLNVLSKA